MSEIELKLALPMLAPSGLARRVGALPRLAGIHARRETLHNTYYETQDLDLLRHGAVLRVREVRQAGKRHWLQTFKLSDPGRSALSRRGEWEGPLEQPSPSADLLRQTPWSSIDPDGRLFEGLQPCFSTRFTRWRWRVDGPDGSSVELALDIGTIHGGTRSLPIRELELELKAGQPQALLDLAQALAGTLPCLPDARSKSERGYALAGHATAAATAPPKAKRAAVPLPVLAQTVLQDTWAEFTARLIAACQGDEPEHIHQARVAWRRFRSARRLFKPALGEAVRAPAPQLQDLLDRLSELRELDVASLDTLPALAEGFVAGDAGRAGQWEALTRALHEARAQERQRLHECLAVPATGQALLAVTRWLESLGDASMPSARLPQGAVAQRAWARRRVRRLRGAWRQARQEQDDLLQQHRARILAKRLRYAIESLQPLLPARRARRWHRQALRSQSVLGRERDLAQAIDRVAASPGAAPIAEFLRGYQMRGGTRRKRRPGG